MPLQVIGAGFGRTGTLSLKAALDELGFGPTYHMDEVVRRPAHVASWLRYARSGEVIWDDVFSRFGSGVDFPVSCAWEALASYYPDSKIVLTVRDPQAWWTSTATTIYPSRTMFPNWLLRLAPVTGEWVEMIDRLVWDGIFDGRFADRDHAVAVFEEHAARVEATCPPDRLLVFDVADGWEPLCSFLDVPVPDRPFPRLNDAKSLRRRFNAIRWGTRAVPVVAAALLVARLGSWSRTTRASWSARRSRRWQRLRRRPGSDAQRQPLQSSCGTHPGRPGAGRVSSASSTARSDDRESPSRRARS